MEKTKGVHSKKTRQYRRHLIGQRLVVGILCVCLLLVSLPAEHFGYLAWAAQKQEIVMFAALPEEVRSQTVSMGTGLEELGLPQTLEAECRPLEEKGFGEVTEIRGVEEGQGDSLPEDALRPEGLAEGQPPSAEGTPPEGSAGGQAYPEEGEGQTPPGGEAPPEEPEEGQTPPEEESPSEEPEEGQTPPEEGNPPEEPGQGQVPPTGEQERVTVEGISWDSEPQYDKEAAGSYVFTPTLPDAFCLAEGVELPEIVVTVRPRRAARMEKQRQDEELQILKEAGEEETLEVLAEEAPLAQPGCGVISQDTVWERNVLLADGELVVEPGVTLTIKGDLIIQGSVTIKGGGKIVRGVGNASFGMGNASNLTVKDITLDGADMVSDSPMITVSGGSLVLDDGCRIQNCVKAASSGAVLNITNGTAVFNDIVIENCSAAFWGGAVCIMEGGKVTINDGTYRNNVTHSSHPWGGGFLYNMFGKAYIYGGRFIDNTSPGRGGCILSYLGDEVETYLYGGYFEGNTCTCPGFEGSGAIMYCAYDAVLPQFKGGILEISGNVQFCGDGTEGSGTDGFYLDVRPDGTLARKLRISNTLSYPVTLYLKASEGYVIAEGINEYTLLHERDMKKIKFVDVGGSGKNWYAVLDKEKNQVYLSEKEPDYGYFVYYISNGAEGTVVDDNEYQIGDTVTVKPADGLKREGYFFKEWNTKADGSGQGYRPGQTFELEGDTDLYAIFADESPEIMLSADFYSGSAGQKKTETVTLGAGAQSGVITAPGLEAMDGWEPLGWNESPSAFTAGVAPGGEVTLTEDKEYYGIYEQDVTLAYDAKGMAQAPEAETGQRHASVQKAEVKYGPAAFTVAPGPKLQGWDFLGWNTQEDGSGETYQEGDALELEEDMTLYAMFQKDLTARFYSGGGGNVDERKLPVTEGDASASLEAPGLEEMDGWEPLGWSESASGYEVGIVPGDDITLTEDKDYYGIYEQDVSLTYVAEEAQSCPEAGWAKRHANVHQQISATSAQFSVGPAAVRLGYAFAGWNTEPDGSGETYREGDKLELEEDMTLYAVFKRPLHATFYSGKAGQSETQVVEIPEDGVSGTTQAPDLETLQLEEPGKAEGWEPAGWDLSAQGYEGQILPGEQIVLTDDTIYYGVYRKGVKLTYVAEGAQEFPKEEQGECRANVHEELGISPAEFTVAPAAVRPGRAFTGWNTQPDGSGETYREGDKLELEEDMVLYAMFQKELTVRFYSGSEGKVEARTLAIKGNSTSAALEMPELMEMEGWRRMGWSTDSTAFESESEAGTTLALTEDTDFYGIYEKDVTVTYEGEGLEGSSEAKPCYANVHNEIAYSLPWFTLPLPAREGYEFLGWNTEADGSGASYPGGSRQQFGSDATLHASWEAEQIPYKVEHYLQEVEGDGYALAEGQTEELLGTVNEEVEAKARKYAGFTENTSHARRQASGKVKADGSLVLRLYYDRDVYQVKFDLNGGSGSVPKPQSLRYGSLLQGVEAPSRAGYNFKGWYLDRAGTKGSQWDFARTVEENTQSQKTTLYAKWADEIAPALGEASFGKGHRDFLGWVLHKDSLKITVPITEEGSGVRQAEYVLTPEDTEEDGGKAQAWGASLKTYGAIGLPLGALDGGGKISRPVKRRARVTEKNGRDVAEFTISEDFKGTVSMTSSDWAGNVSAAKVLTADGKGAIVEDNAPLIRFTPDARGQYDNASVIGVEVRDNADGNVSGGIAGISYQLDDGKEVSLPEEAFRRGIVESYQFTLKISGAGNHILHVEAEDNAGNKSSQQTAVDIRGNGATPSGPEPKTGDGSHVEVYATASMIAGFTYLLLYFRDHGMTEEKKEELVSRLVNWAKGKGGVRRAAALTLIFLLLAYYHTIGKNVEGEWEEAFHSG